jgi:aminoglycoside phosphotransferase (APT) family kinase protein
VTARPLPLSELDDATVAAMLAPVLGGRAPRAVAPAEGGLTNAVYRVTAADGAAYALRVHAADDAAAFDRERRLLARLAGVLPVPEPLHAEDAARLGRACTVYRWLDGVTLNECRRGATADELLTLAAPLGALLARVAGAVPAEELGALAPPVRVAERVALTVAALRAGRARARLGDALADSLCARLAARAPRLEALERPAELVHGDFGGRNVLVRPAGDGRWAPSGVLDWESAGAGSRLWDVGSLFRYACRYPPPFRAAFARGYRDAGGTLPSDWWDAARLLDATRLVAILAEPRELPTVFPECRDLIASLLDASSSSLPR